MAFGDVIRSAASPFTLPTGIGGKADVIWHCEEYGDFAELSPTDLSAVRTQADVIGGDGARGLGGTTTVIWASDRAADRIVEVSETDFSVVRSAASPSTDPHGAGGTDTVIWFAETPVTQVYELSTTDLSVVRSGASPAVTVRDIGGNDNYIWHNDNNGDFWELSVADFSVIRSVTGTVLTHGVGGDNTVIWGASYSTDLVYELDEALITEKFASDTATGVEALTQTVLLVKADTGSGIDAVVELIKLIEKLASDSGVGTDTLVALLADITKADTGTGADTIINRVFSAIDSGLGIDELLSIALRAKDDGQGTDALVSLLAAILKSDSGAGVDASTLTYIRVLQLILKLRQYRDVKVNIR